MGRFAQAMDMLKYRGVPPRELWEGDYDGFFKAASTPNRDEPKGKTRDGIRARLLLDNPIRWRRLQRDYRWLEKRMKKLGANPEDARFIL